MSAPLSAVALAAAFLLHAVALALGERSYAAAAVVLLAEGLALAGVVVLGWNDICDQPPSPYRCGGLGARRVAAQFVVAAAVALEAGRLPSPARAARVSAITAYTRISA